MIRQFGERGTSSDPARPTDKAGHPDAPFVDPAFPTAHARVVTTAVGAVVGDEDDNGIFLQAPIGQFLEQTAKVVIQVLDHAIHCRAFVAQAPGFVLVKVAIGQLEGTVGNVVGQVAEERLVAVAVDEVDRLVSQHIGDIAFGRENGIVVNETGIEVVGPMPGGKADKLLKALAQRIVGIVRAVVPLAEDPCPVAVCLKDLGQGQFLRTHVFGAPRYPKSPCSQMITSRQQGGPGRRTNGTDVELIQPRAGPGQRIDDRGIDGVVAMNAQVTIPLIVGEDKQHIGAWGRCYLAGRKKTKQAQGQ